MSIVHLVCATLREDASEEAVARAIDLGRSLRDAPGVRHALLGRSAERLVAVTWLEGRAALEPFAASPVHMAFVMRGLAPCIRGMWSAGVESDAEPPTRIDGVWVFALRAAETLFEWQVRDLLHSVQSLPGVAAAGATVEERDRYRAGGAICLAAHEIAAFEAALEAARSTWGAVAGAIVEAKVEVIPLHAGGDSATDTAHDR